LKPEERESFATDDAALLQFAFRFLRQVMFGEESIALNAEAAQERLVKVQEKRLIEEREAAKKRALESGVRRGRRRLRLKTVGAGATARNHAQGLSTVSPWIPLKSLSLRVASDRP
jgi:hypothetical protein